MLLEEWLRIRKCCNCHFFCVDDLTCRVRTPHNDELLAPHVPLDYWCGEFLWEELWRETMLSLPASTPRIHIKPIVYKEGEE
jgi:hypothetical protein